MMSFLSPSNSLFLLSKSSLSTIFGWVLWKQTWRQSSRQVYWGGGVLQEINLQGSEEDRTGQKAMWTCNEIVPEAPANPAERSRAGMGFHSCKSRQRVRPLCPLSFSRGHWCNPFQRPSTLLQGYPLLCNHHVSAFCLLKWLWASQPPERRHELGEGCPYHQGLF